MQAAFAGVSVRMLQRAARIRRICPELEPRIMAGELKLGAAEAIARQKEIVAIARYLEEHPQAE